MKLLTSPDPAAWDDYVLQNRAGLFEYSVAYRRLLCELLDCEDWSLATEHEDQIVAVLPLLAKDGPYGRVFNSQPYCSSYGGILAESLEAANVLQLASIELARDAASVTTVGNPLASPVPRLGWPVAARIDYFSVLDSTTSSRFEPRTYSAIRKALRSNVRVERDRELLDWLVDVHHENMAAVGAPPKSRQFFELLRESEIHWDVYVARIGPRPVAAALLVYFGDNVSYWTPAASQPGRPTQALSLILASAIDDAAALGYRRWDWGSCRPDQTSLQLFKRQWAATPVEATSYVDVSLGRFAGADPAELQHLYPGFYVLPYGELERYAGHQSDAPRSATSRS